MHACLAVVLCGLVLVDCAQDATLPSMPVNLHAILTRSVGLHLSEEKDPLAAAFYWKHGLLVSRHSAIRALPDRLEARSEGRAFPARVVCTDEKHDLALLESQLDVQVPALERVPISQLRPGVAVCASAAPFGLSQSLQCGYIANVRQGTARLSGPLVQTHGLAFPEASGSGTFLADGRLIGILLARDATPGLLVGMVVPWDVAREFIERCRK